MRRALVIALAALAIAPAAAPADDRVVPFSVPLTVPEVLSGSDLTIPMQETEVQILPGKKTKMWTYGGSFPGPTIRRPSGSVTRVKFANQLPAQAGDMSVHLHGGHVAADEDGQPHSLLIPPGGERTYRWDHVEGAADEPAAFQWYHDHRMDVTGRNVWNGLAGMFILDEKSEQALPLPKGEYDVPLMVADRSFDEDNRLTYPDPIPAGTGLLPGTGKPPSDEVTGDVILVNGRAQPYFEVAARRYRLRLLNASNFRTFDFAMSDGRAMTQIATESGLLPAPVDRTAIPLGPAERAEVVVDFAGMVGETVTLTSQAGDVMQFRVTREAPEPDTSSVPATLRALPALGESSVERSFNFGLGTDPKKGRLAWTINQQVFDHARADATPRAGETETWQLTNLTSSGVPHYVHIHAVDFRVLSRDGEAPPPWEAGFKETVKVDPNETVIVQARFGDHLGEFVFHCHMLEHEDNGMMGRFVVTAPPGEEPAPPRGREDDGTAAQEPPPAAAPAAGLTTDRSGEPTSRVAAGRANVAVAFVRPPRALRNGRLTRLRVRVTNTSDVAVRGVRVRLRLPRGFRARKRTATVAALAPRASRTIAFRVKAPARLGGRRLRLHVEARTPGDALADDDTAQLEYRTGRARARAAGGRSVICVLR
jgi:FtsP/CotA-like multicopper oxidase with cupredoxin domain